MLAIFSQTAAHGDAREERRNYLPCKQTAYDAEVKPGSKLLNFNTKYLNEKLFVIYCVIYHWKRMYKV